MNIFSRELNTVNPSNGGIGIMLNMNKKPFIFWEIVKITYVRIFSLLFLNCLQISHNNPFIPGPENAINALCNDVAPVPIETYAGIKNKIGELTAFKTTPINNPK